jgi:transposase
MSVTLSFVLTSSMDDPVWDATTFSKNRERLLQGDVAQAFFEQVVRQAREKRLLSEEHFRGGGKLSTCNFIGNR